MGKKKKRNFAPASPSLNHRKGGDGRAVSPPSRPLNAHASEETILDALRLRLDASPNSGTSRIQKPSVMLSRRDARLLDLLPNDDVILLSCPTSDDDDAASPHPSSTAMTTGTDRIDGAAWCKVAPFDKESGQGSRGLSPGKRPGVAQGDLRVHPPSVTEILCPARHPSEIKSVTNRELAASTPASSSSSVTSPSFSFKIGGGGDQLYSSPAKAASTPNSRTAPTQTSPPQRRLLWVIPVASSLGQRVQGKLCRRASTLHLELADASSEGETTGGLLGAERILKRIMLAHLVGRNLQVGEVVSVSFRGRTRQVRVVSASGNDENAEVCEVKESLRALSLASPSASTAAPVYAEDDVASVERALTSCSLRLFEVVHSTCIELVTNTPEALLSPRDRPRKELVVGLDAILDQLRSFLMTHLSRAELFRNRNLKPPRGVLLFGAPGVGKSSLAKQLASELEAEGTFDVEFVNCVSLQSQTAIVGQAERTLSRFFRLPPPIETKKSTRAKLLVLDDIHLICPKRGGYNSGTDRLTATLLSLMDGLDSSDQIYTLAVTGQPSVLDPALRRPGRLDAEIEVPIPDDAPTRAEILKFHVTNFSSALDGADEDQWLDLAKLAKGFNGADCMLAVKEALRHSILARSCDSPLVPPDATGDTMTGRPLSLTVEDLKAGIRSTKPSAIKSITVEIPQVQWSSIGGMESVKNELFEALELPLTHGSLLQRLRVPPPRGILFYGPPGCAKTLMARALATQGHMNFLAVKGPELLSKWLGESERALASLFRRARMASPSIIFFDEIDAIACRRGGSGENASNRLLSQLLTELDGVNSTGSVANAASSCSSSSIAASGASSKPKQQRVVVIGATNRPDLLDPALTRPGRIDRLIYVGVPDERGRAQIFRIGLRGRACDDDVNVEELAQERVSGGYSGAEIAAICRDAALLALEEASNENTSNVLAGGGSPIHIGQRHLLQAVSGMKRQITPEMTAFYDSYRDGSGSSKKNQKRL